MWLIIAGGVPMLFVAVFGLVSIAAAARYAYAPGDGRFSHIAALCASVAFASLAGFAADLMTVAVTVSGTDEWSSAGNLPVYVLAGFGESMAPLILGFSMVAGAAILTAIGLRRAPATV